MNRDVGLLAREARCSRAEAVVLIKLMQGDEEARVYAADLDRKRRLRARARELRTKIWDGTLMKGGWT